MAKGMCGKCGIKPSQPTHNNCRECHNKTMRKWRKTHPMTPEQQRKNNCSSYANTYLGRGKIKKPEKCECCNISPAQQMHHEDYDKPLEIIWLCKKCHKELHKKRETFKDFLQSHNKKYVWTKVIKSTRKQMAFFGYPLDDFLDEEIKEETILLAETISNGSLTMEKATEAFYYFKIGENKWIFQKLT